MRITLLLFSLGFAFGCDTHFVGDPHISIPTCKAKCAQSQLEMSGIIYLGEYSSACICEVPRAASARTGIEPAQVAGAVGASAGVIQQMRSNEEAAQVNTTLPR